MTLANSNTEASSAKVGTGAKSTISPDNRDLRIERIFDAPRELVFKAWTDPKQMAKWWGPKWFTNPICEMDARPGGAIRIHMADPEGNIFPMTGVFVDIVEPERLVISTTALKDEAGSELLQALATVTFEDYGGKTKLTLHEVVTWAAPDAEGALSGMEEGWNQSLDSLAELVATL